MAEPQLQSSLGVVAQNSNRKDRSWNNGYLAFGKVLKVHAKRYTADVQLYGSSDTIMSSTSNEGVHSCRIGVGNAGVDGYFKKPYGEIVPIQKGSIVLIGFIRNTTKKPVILRVFHNITEEMGERNYNNILTSAYPVDSEEDLFRYTNISRIQDFVTMDGIGNFEVASHTKSFFVGINKKEIDEENFDYEDLSIRNPDGTVVKVDEVNSKPMKFLAVFRDKFLDGASNSLRVIIDSARTAFRLAKLQKSENKLSMFEIDQNGAIKLRRQLDTKSWQEDSKNYTEICITSDGNIEITLHGSKETSLKVTGAGLNIDTKDSVSVTAESDINLSSKSVSIKGDVEIIGSGKINGKRIAVEGDSTSDGASIN